MNESKQLVPSYLVELAENLLHTKSPSIDHYYKYYAINYYSSFDGYRIYLFDSYNSQHLYNQKYSIPFIRLNIWGDGVNVFYTTLYYDENTGLYSKNNARDYPEETASLEMYVGSVTNAFESVESTGTSTSITYEQLLPWFWVFGGLISVIFLTIMFKRRR